MKKILSAIFFFGWMRVARAQGAPQAVLEQITALKAYIATEEEGAKMVEQGLSAIRDIRNAEFEQHQTFFQSLQWVNPKIQNMSQLQEIVDRQESCIDQLNKGMARWQACPWLHVMDIRNARYFGNKLVSFTTEALENLYKLTTDPDYKMTDGERWEQIENCLNNIKYIDGAIAMLINSFDRIVLERQKSYESIDLVKDWYKLP